MQTWRCNVTPVPGYGTHVNTTTWKTRKRKKRKLDYLRISAGKQRGIYVHRLVAEALLRRRLRPNETVDHSNQDSTDCDPSNILVLSWSDHTILTNKRRYHSNDGVAGVDYQVILDGSKLFER